MISHKKKFVFFHIPKCGGTSVLSILSKYNDEDKYKDGHPPLFAILDMGLANYFIFTFTRNPFDRLVSAFNYIKKGNTGWHYDELLRRKMGIKNMDFKEFVKTKLKNTENCGHFNPIFDYVSDENIQNINFIGKIENLQEDFDTICDKIGIPQQQLPHKNTTNHKHYTEYYDDETKQIVAEKYAKDIEYFGYEFGE